jgi:hypothetical protein
MILPNFMLVSWSGRKRRIWAWFRVEVGVRFGRVRLPDGGGYRHISWVVK